MTKTARIRELIVLVLLATVLVVPACLFDTREADDPAQGGNTISLDDPLKVFVALSETLNDSQQDANYERALSTTFIFSPSLQDSLDQNFIGTGVFDNWNKDREMAVLGRLLADAQTLHAEFNPTAEINKNTFVRFRVEYSLDVVPIAAPADTNQYRGVAYFDVRLESGNWRLTFWDEAEGVDGYPSWGYLRGILGL
ncbi:MAG TPA: hypothetical protein VFX92_02205 [Candidatus Krumholzibacteria bacterium]|nr:hypothetical protein [Candidatus Krumholzibacteria bacterium]